jgi:hypothetical protein
MAQQVDVTVKGHTLGESAAVFAERFGCSQLLSLSAKEAKRSKVTGDVAECRSLSSARDGRLVVPLARLQDGPFIVRGYGGDQASFRDGSLVAITVTSLTWDKPKGDVVERYGKPSRTWEERLGNLYGASFMLHRAVWELPGGVTIVALEEFIGNDPRIPQTKVTFFAPGEALKLHSEQPKMPSTLD